MGPFLFSCVLDDDENSCSTKRESVLGAGATLRRVADPRIALRRFEPISPGAPK